MLYLIYESFSFLSLLYEDFIKVSKRKNNLRIWSRIVCYLFLIISDYCTNILIFLFIFKKIK